METFEMQEALVYKIGDTGPAGGIVFYDRGFTEEGSRYLEAAPAETEFEAEWGAYGTDVAGTSTEVGSGKQNTRLIIDKLEALGETGMAAQLCACLNFNGYNDWFLPSKDELDLMYKNLQQKGLGEFGDHFYWFSSQYDYQFAWIQNFGDGNQYKYDKGGYVRAIRAF
jgi:hypothetical protein